VIVELESASRFEKFSSTVHTVQRRKRSINVRRNQSESLKLVVGEVVRILSGD
jgi:hypothetical protein